MDVSSRMNLFDLKTKFNFQTVPGVCDYNMPLYNVQNQGSGLEIAPFPVYQNFIPPVYCNRIEMLFYTQRELFINAWQNYIQPLQQVATADGISTNYSFSLPFNPIVPGHVDITGILAQYNSTGMSGSGTINDPPVGSTLNTAIPCTSVYPGVYITATGPSGENIIISDSGQFLASNQTYGLLMQPQGAPLGGLSLGIYSTTQNTVSYATGSVNVTFPVVLPAGTPIQVQCLYWQQGIPVSVLFFNNTMTILPPPSTQYFIEINAYLTPAAFLSSSEAIPFGYMAEYIARGAARKILSDTGDVEQFMFYEPLFKEQEILVWKRSQRIFTSTRTETIYSIPNGRYWGWGSAWGWGGY